MSPFPSPGSTCPQCGRPMVESAPICECGHSFYPRAPSNKRLPGLGPMTPEERVELRANAARFLGFVSLGGLLAGPYGLLAALLATMFGISTLNSAHRRKAVVGLTCAAIGLVLSIISLYFLVRGSWGFEP